MLQAKLIRPQEIVFENVKIPQVKDDDVLVRTKMVGICGSDIHTYFGVHPFVKKYPVVQGHEFSGVIVKIGKNVENLKVGQKITALPSVICGRCFNCLNNRSNICSRLKVMAFQIDGTLRDYFTVKKDRVVPLPEKINYLQGAMIEPLAVAIHSIKKAGNVKNKNVLVLGAGTIGILTSAVAKIYGAGKVMISDIDNFRLNYAKKFNIDFVVNVKSKNLESQVYKYFGRHNTDIVFECVGIDKTINQAINILPKGAKIVVVGVFSEKVEVDIGLVQDKELEIVGSLMYQKDEFLEAINLICKNKINPSLLITHRFSFEKLKDAYDLVEKKENFLKIMIEF